MTDDYNDRYERAEAMEMAQDRMDEERAEFQAQLDAKDQTIADMNGLLAFASEKAVGDSEKIASLERRLEAADRRIAQLEHTNLDPVRVTGNRQEATDRRVADLSLRLSIATESNVNDRKLIASLESQLAASRDIIRHFEQERDSWPAAYRERAKRTDARIERLQAGLATIRADLLSLKAHSNGASPATCERIIQKVDDLLPSEET